MSEVLSQSSCLRGSSKVILDSGFQRVRGGIVAVKVGVI